MPISQNKEKSLLRQQMRTKRTKLCPEEAQVYSQIMQQKLDQNIYINSSQVIMGFYSILNEVDIMAWLIKAKSVGKTILLPRVENHEEMVAVEFQGWEHTQVSKMGIIEPIGKPFAIEKIDAILVPGLVFDKRGYRLGYGRGYYDRFLPGLKESVYTFGICYSFQVVENIWPHSCDIPVQGIITE